MESSNPVFSPLNYQVDSEQQRENESIGDTRLIHREENDEENNHRIFNKQEETEANNDRLSKHNSARMREISKDTVSHNPVIFVSYNSDLYHTYAPLLTYFTAFLFAWIYTIIPSQNYYVFFLVKGQLWNMLATSCFTELFTVVLSDIQDEIYILVYLIGWIVVPTYYIVAKLTGLSNPTIAILVTIVPLLGVVIGFGYSAWMYPKSARQLRKQRQYEEKKRISRQRGEVLTDEVKQWQAMFEATRLSRLSNASNASTLSTSTDTAIDSVDRSVESGTTPSLYPTPSISCAVEMSSFPPSLLLSPSHIDTDAVSSHTTSHSPTDTSPTSAATSSKPDTDKLFPTWISHILHPSYFFYLPKYWTWYQFDRVGHLPHTVDRRYLWLLVSLLVYLFTQDYLFLVFFTNRFRNSKQSTTSSIKLFLAYIVVTTIFRIAIKFLGMQLDKYRKRCVSMYFVGEVMGLLYYYTFYRVLFESIRSISEFALFQFVHLASEWLLYTIRSSQWYYDITDKLMRQCVPLKWCLSEQRLSLSHWQEFIALDFGIRCSIFVSTGYGILLLLITIQFVPWVGDTNGLRQDLAGFRYTTGFLFIAVVLELINAFAMMKLFFEPRKLDALRMTRHCYSLRHFAFLSMLIAANLFINPVYAFTTVPT